MLENAAKIVVLRVFFGVSVEDKSRGEGDFIEKKWGFLGLEDWKGFTFTNVIITINQEMEINEKYNE